MSLHHDYRPHCVLTILQACIIIAGSLFTRAVLKFMGYPLQDYEVQPLPVFIRDGAWLLLFIPLVWMSLCLWLEIHSPTFTRRASIVSGVILLALLTLLMAIAVSQASTKPRTFTTFEIGHLA